MLALISVFFPSLCQVKSKLEKIQDELSEKERRLKWLNEELEQIIHYNRELNDTAVRFRETVQKAEGLEDKKALYNETLESLKGSMTVLNGVYQFTCMSLKALNST